MLWTEKARTSSRVLRLATRLGEMSFRDLVRVVKASSPERARPTTFQSVVVLSWTEHLPRKMAQSLAGILTTCCERIIEPGWRRP